VYPITLTIKGRREVELRCIVDTGAPVSVFYDSLYADDPNQATGTQAIGSEQYTSQMGLCSVTINKTKVPKRLPLTLVDRKVKGYDGLIGYDLLIFCHMTVYRGNLCWWCHRKRIDYAFLHATIGVSWTGTAVSSLSINNGITCFTRRRRRKWVFIKYKTKAYYLTHSLQNSFPIAQKETSLRFTIVF
jgi:hypothetical protein